MATYKGICELTNKKETIWFNMISASTQLNPNGTTVGLMIKCSVNNKVCDKCNIYEDLLRAIT